jgi:hypothetical protein
MSILFAFVIIIIILIISVVTIKLTTTTEESKKVGEVKEAVKEIEKPKIEIQQPEITDTGTIQNEYDESQFNIIESEEAGIDIDATQIIAGIETGDEIGMGGSDVSSGGTGDTISGGITTIQFIPVALTLSEAPEKSSLSTQNTRYVKVFNIHNGLYISEIYIYNQNALNVAEGVEVHSSSGAGVYTAEKAVDNNLNTITATDDTYNSYFYAKLNQTTFVKQIKLYYSNDDKLKMDDIRLELLDDDMRQINLTKLYITDAPDGYWIINYNDDGSVVILTKQLVADQKARYIRIEKSMDNDALSMTEVEVIDKNSVNIALGKPATQSSTYEAWTSADRAVNGMFTGTYYAGDITHTWIVPNPGWWEVNLVNDYDIATIRITNRKDCCGERIIGAVVKLLDSNKKIIKEFPPITNNQPTYTFNV